MAKIKLTKNELKNQRDGLRRFARYLPTLQLKKQQLQIETRRVRDELEHLVAEETAAITAISAWIGLLDEAAAAQLLPLLRIADFADEIRNIAGIDMPVFRKLEFAPAEYDLFATAPWFDDLVAGVERLVEFKLHHTLLEEQLHLIEEELLITSQRVNLFEKVKIPQAKENIRRIQIYLGDQQTNAVGRAKLAKGKIKAKELLAAELS